MAVSHIVLSVLFLYACQAYELNFDNIEPVIKGIRAKHNIHTNVPDFRESIIWGKNATAGQFPHHCALLLKVDHNKTGLCGSSIIAPNKILTAAHCLDLVKAHPENAYVVCGEIEVAKFKNSKLYQGKRVHMHPGYNGKIPEGLHNDVAILQLKEDIEFNDNVKPIAINGLGSPAVGSYLPLAGFGRVSWYNMKKVATHLQHVNLTVREMATCEKFFQKIPFKKQLCVYSVAAPCQGDSGGALVMYDDQNKPYAAGLTSFGTIFCVGFPTIFTDVYEHHTFIQTILDQD